MRTLEQIRERLLNSNENEEKRAFKIGLGQDLNAQLSHLRVLYDMSINLAVHHKSNDHITKELFALSWVIGSNTNYHDLPYLQYNLPRLRMIAREFLFPWPGDNPSLWRMAAGEPCDKHCPYCDEGRKLNG